ncbi:hypothetical protein CL620_04665 [archaeon]|nr:hypothetical protein [archaeon]
MTYRIITHGGCSSMDGFSSAFIFKKYFCPLFDITDVEIIGLNPYDIQNGEFEFTDKDIVLDLPLPQQKIFFWCDHHLSAKPKDTLPENHYFKEVPSCAGLLIDILKEKGVKITEALQEFKKVIDIMDGAEYSKDDIKLVYYQQASYDNPTTLEKLHMISAMMHTRDQFVNWEFFRTLLEEELGETPIDSETWWDLRPRIFYKALLASYAEWREWVDEFIVFNDESKCVVQDNRVAESRQKGNTDRFYQYIKFDDASYGINMKVVDKDVARIGIGSNIFHKDRCKINIGRVCKEVADKFGDGAGGGHYYVGGCTINAEKCDDALAFILERMEN